MVNSLEASQQNKGTESSLVHAELLRWWAAIVANRLRIMAWVLGGALLGVVFFLASPRKYTAVASLISTSTSSSGSSLLSQAQMLTGLSLAQSDNAQAYPVVCESRQVLLKVLGRDFKGTPVKAWIIDSLNLDAEADDQWLEAHLLEYLRDILTVTYKSQEGLIEIKLTAGDADLAAFTVNSVIDELMQFMNQMREEENSLKHGAVEARILEVADSLSMSESDLLEFRLRNRNLEQSPALQMEEDQLRRAVELFGQVYVELNRQSEILKIEKFDQTTQFIPLDRAVPPVTPSSPKLMRLVVYFLLVGLAMAFLDVQLILWGETSRWRPLLKLFKGQVV